MFLALANTTNFISRAGAIPFLWFSMVAYNVIVVCRDPGAIQALMNNLFRTSHRFYGNPFPNLELIAATS